MKKWDRKYMSLEHPVVPESKEVFFKKKKENLLMGVMSKGHRSQIKKLQIAKSGTIWAAN